jgi:hypothetical protein
MWFLIDHFISSMTKATKTMDLVFLIDATGSMSSSLKGAHDKATSLAQLLRNDSPDVDFHFGCVCYRDPVDVDSDMHEVLGLSPTIEELVKFLSGIQAVGGGDGPEDWVGAYSLALKEMNWRDGAKTIIHIADAPAHGSIWGGPGHEEEAPKLIPLIQNVAKKRIVVTALGIGREAAPSFEACKRIYDAAQGPGFDYQDLQISPNYEQCIYDEHYESDGGSLRECMDESHCIGMQMCMQTQCACLQALDDRY